MDLWVVLIEGHTLDGSDGGKSDVIVALGSDGDVFSATETVSCSVCGGCTIEDVAASCGGGKRLKKLRSRGCRDCARRMCSTDAIVKCVSIAMRVMFQGRGRVSTYVSKRLRAKGRRKVF